MWRDDSILSFVDRLKRDSEFREWFVQDPRQALASYGLKESDLHYLHRALDWDSSRREVAGALRPFVRMLIQAAEEPSREPDRVYAQLTDEIDGLKTRVAEAQERDRAARPWWKFWLW